MERSDASTVLGNSFLEPWVGEVRTAVEADPVSVVIMSGKKREDYYEVRNNILF